MPHRDKLFTLFMTMVVLALTLPAGAGIGLCTAAALHAGILPAPWSLGWIALHIVVWLVGSVATFAICAGLAWHAGTRLLAVLNQEVDAERAAQAAAAEKEALLRRGIVLEDDIPIAQPSPK